MNAENPDIQNTSQNRSENRNRFGRVLRKPARLNEYQT